MFERLNGKLPILPSTKNTLGKYKNEVGTAHVTVGVNFLSIFVTTFTG